LIVGKHSNAAILFSAFAIIVLSLLFLGIKLAEPLSPNRLRCIS